MLRNYKFIIAYDGTRFPGFHIIPISHLIFYRPPIIKKGSKEIHLLYFPSLYFLYHINQRFKASQSVVPPLDSIVPKYKFAHTPDPE